MYYYDYSAMSSEITQRVLKKQLQYHLAHSALASLGKNKQCNPILQRKHNIKTQTLANKCTQVNTFHSQYSTEQLQHVQKVTFVSRKFRLFAHSWKYGIVHFCVLYLQSKNTQQVCQFLSTVHRYADHYALSYWHILFLSWC